MNMKHQKNYISLCQTLGFRSRRLQSVGNSILFFFSGAHLLVLSAKFLYPLPLITPCSLRIVQNGAAIHPPRMICKFLVNLCIIKHWLNILSKSDNTNNLGRKLNNIFFPQKEGSSIIWTFLWNARKVPDEKIGECYNLTPPLTVLDKLIKDYFISCNFCALSSLNSIKPRNLEKNLWIVK